MGKIDRTLGKYHRKYNSLYRRSQKAKQKSRPAEALSLKINNGVT